MCVLVRECVYVCVYCLSFVFVCECVCAWRYECVGVRACFGAFVR